MHKTIRHVRHHAKKHVEAHLRLKTLLGMTIRKEKVLSIFAITFTVTLLTLIIFLNWGHITDLFKKDIYTPPETEGVTLGLISARDTEKFAHKKQNDMIASLSISAGEAMVRAARNLGYPGTGMDALAEADSFSKSVWMATYLGSGENKTFLRRENSALLQKTVISAYYFGRTTNLLHTALMSDTQLLQEIDNTLSIDLFQYLNQSYDRSQTLDSYLKLLQEEQSASSQRINDLKSKINFLSAVVKSNDTQINLSEKQVIENIKRFNGRDAEAELKTFTEKRQSDVETRAKLGAYKNLLGYFNFYQPKLDTMIKAIKANREALIAGVKVTEIQNMTLPLIIRSK